MENRKKNLHLFGHSPIFKNLIFIKLTAFDTILLVINDIRDYLFEFYVFRVVLLQCNTYFNC